MPDDTVTQSPDDPTAPLASVLLSAIRAALAFMHEPGEVVELRIPQTRRGTLAGYFDNLDLLADCAASHSGSAEGIYVTMNPVNPELLARSANRLDRLRHTTADVDIVRRRWLLLDFDPRRPAGISSTEDEHQYALDRARSARAWLRDRGWGGSIFADSGNGAHLVYPIRLPNDAPATTLVTRCLQALDLQFSDQRVIVDTTTANPARLIKVYGTLSCKGDSRSERPHRMARVLDIEEPR